MFRYLGKTRFLVAALFILTVVHPEAFGSCCDSPGKVFSKNAENGKNASLLKVPFSGDRTSTEGMVLIPGGVFIAGGAGPKARADEFPRHRVRVNSFWMDEKEVTNAQFKKFVEETGYLTTAERPVDWEELKKVLPASTPKPPEEKLRPGSLVFTGLSDKRSKEGMWWQWVNGADWRHPEGPGSNIEGKSNHPVVQVTYEDAQAYCKWAGKRLPTEAEWEYACRGGLSDCIYSWGNQPVKRDYANIWQGTFPHVNTKDDGYLTTAPVGSFKKNGFGLYDMAGNVWEWCSDFYKSGSYLARMLRCGPEHIHDNPTGPSSGFDRRHPGQLNVHVIKGGSYLCHHSYCESYRPGARMSCPDDTSMPHIGFRCVKDFKTQE